MSKDITEIAADITIAWINSAASTVDTRVTGEVVVEFYKSIYEALDACAHPQRDAKCYAQKPTGW